MTEMMAGMPATRYFSGLPYYPMSSFVDPEMEWETMEDYTGDELDREEGDEEGDAEGISAYLREEWNSFWEDVESGGAPWPPPRVGRLDEAVQHHGGVPATLCVQLVELVEQPAGKEDAASPSHAERSDCAICLSLLHQSPRGQLMHLLRLPCGHAFHQACICKWLVRSAVCPNCRAPVLNSSGELSQQPPHRFAPPEYRGELSQQPPHNSAPSPLDGS